MLDGVSQVDGIHGELNFADTTKEICDENTSRISQEQVSTMAWSGHTLTLWTHFELWRQRQQRFHIRNIQHCSKLVVSVTLDLYLGASQLVH